jgi:L-cystine uptake protein TcyP (sodium:dicarboxylate symporter family)
VRLPAVANLGKIGASVISLLVFTTMIAALIGVVVAGLFGLSAEGITGGERETARAAELVARQETLRELDLADAIVSFVPTNIFADLAGTRDTSVIAVVIFGMLLGAAALLVSREQPAQAQRINELIETTRAIDLCGREFQRQRYSESAQLCCGFLSRNPAHVRRAWRAAIHDRQ